MVDRADDTQALWLQYKRSGDRALRDRLILTYAPLVKYVAGRLGSGLPAHVEEGDLVSYGLLGLIGAIERFDPERDIKFETYAIARIKGSIIDELRSMDWVPRSVRARARDIERTIATLEAKHARAPTDEEIAHSLGITEEEFQDSLLEISRTSIPRPSCASRRGSPRRSSARPRTSRLDLQASLLVAGKLASRAALRAEQDPERRRRRAPGHREDVARRGDALPGRRHESPRIRRGVDDRVRLGRGRAPPADVAGRFRLPPRMAGPQDQPARHARRPRLPGGHARVAPRRRGRADGGQRRQRRRGADDAPG